MTPIVAQIVITAIQGLIQVVTAKLAQEERIVIVIDPESFTSPEEREALDTVCRRAMMLHKVGSHTTSPEEL